MNTLKSIGAILAGMVLIVVLSNGTDVVLEKNGIFPTYPQPMVAGWMATLAIFYRAVAGILGAYVAALLAPARPMRHALIIGYIGVVISAAGLIVVLTVDNEFTRVARQTPMWYTIALIIIALPCAWLGGKLKTRSAALSAR